MTDTNPKFFSEQQRPTRLQVRLELASMPATTSFTRFLEFERYDGVRVSAPLALSHGSGLNWAFDTAAAYLSPNAEVCEAAGKALHALGTLVDTGRRGCWDRMFLVNKGGNTELDLARVNITLSYGGVSYDLPTTLAEREIALVDDVFAARLSKNCELSLDAVALATRLRFAGVGQRSHKVLHLVAADLGKSGSDGADEYGANPKYGSRLDNLCSEFASWYYHEAGVTIGGRSLRDVDATQQVHDLFAAAGQLYKYQLNSDSFIRVGGAETYLPKPGDFLERRGPEGAEHSMIVHSCLPGNPRSPVTHERTPRLVVYNGPWPVFLREIRLRQSMINDQDEYLIGRI